MKRLTVVFIFLVLFSSLVVGAGFDFSKIKNNISEFTLPNGLKFILIEDHSVPIASFVTYVNVGSSDERIGIYGISHFFEHIAFKGTSEIGTNDAKAEKKLMAKMDVLFDKILREQQKFNPDKKKLEAMKKELAELGKKAKEYVIPNDFDSIIKKNGGTGLNAGTNTDATIYFVNFPSNKLELWSYLESGRFVDPVFREFYKERNVIAEERRMRTENMVIGKMLEEILALCFKDHPYHFTPIGPMSNIKSITRADMRYYFRTNYTASNMVIGVYGDVTPKQLKKMAKKYFARIRKGQRNFPIVTNEPPQRGEKTMVMYENSQPWLVLAYHCPSVRHEDFLKFGLLQNIFTNGRSSRLYKKMVIEEKTAMQLFSFAGLPGTKYPSLFIVLALPNSGHKTMDLLKDIDKGLERLKNEPVTEEELASAKIRMKISRISGMKSRVGFLMTLLGAEVKQGSWKKAFDEIDEIDKITAKDIQELAKKYFKRNNRNLLRIEKTEDKTKDKTKAKKEVKK